MHYLFIQFGSPIQGHTVYPSGIFNLILKPSHLALLKVSLAFKVDGFDNFIIIQEAADFSNVFLKITSLLRLIGIIIRKSSL